MNKQDIRALIKRERNYKLIVGLFNGLFKRFQKYEVINSELIPIENNCIFVFNHSDYLDIPIIFSILGKRPAHALVKIELKKEFLGKILSLIGTVFVDRVDYESRRLAKNTLIDIVSQGGNILLAPEGMRNRTDAVLLPFNGYGAVKIAQKTKCPIIIFAISKYRKNAKKRFVRICDPFFIKEDESLDFANNRLRNYLYNALIKNEETTNI